MFQQLRGGALVALAAFAALASCSSSHPSSHSSALNALEANDVEEHNQENWFGRRAAVPIPDPASRVNLFIGTTSTGHAFPGVTVPHGMIKVGMDTDSGDNHAGYDANPNTSATGFSQLHDDGTGGVRSRAVILPLLELY